jgi:hypothetical protein
MAQMKVKFLMLVSGAAVGFRVSIGVLRSFGCEFSHLFAPGGLMRVPVEKLWQPHTRSRDSIGAGGFAHPRASHHAAYIAATGSGCRERPSTPHFRVLMARGPRFAELCTLGELCCSQCRRCQLSDTRGIAVATAVSDDALLCAKLAAQQQPECCNCADNRTVACRCSSNGKGS